MIFFFFFFCSDPTNHRCVSLLLSRLPSVHDMCGHPETQDSYNMLWWPHKSWTCAHVWGQALSTIYMAIVVVTTQIVGFCPRYDSRAVSMILLSCKNIQKSQILAYHGCCYPCGAPATKIMSNYSVTIQFNSFIASYTCNVYGVLTNNKGVQHKTTGRLHKTSTRWHEINLC